jgi:hypothetical protein
VKRFAPIAALLLLLTGTAPVKGHHGVASLGTAGLEGPGAPIETSNSATLPQGTLLLYSKFDHAKFERYTDARDDEGDFSTFWMYGLGYGVKPYLSLYLFVPYSVKSLEDNSFNTAGFTDISLVGVLGFTWDEGLRLVPKNQSLDDLMDWHFTLYSGLSLPTGDAEIRDADDTIDPGMSLGFGRPSYTLGATATRQFTDRNTWVFDMSYITFTEHQYDDGNRTRFGDELRINTAWAHRLLTLEGHRFRLDTNLEANYLRLGRDEFFGAGEPATGGQMVYGLPGLRLYYRDVSLGLGLKIPIWTDLNEEREQQGAEGRERHRAIVTFSVMF